MPDQLYAALRRISRHDAAADARAVLAAAAREAARLGKADLVVVRLAGGLETPLSARAPARAPWPSDRLVARWAAQAARARGAVALPVATVRRAGFAAGLALPVTSAARTDGVLVACAGHALAREAGALMLAPVLAASASLELARVRRESETLAAAAAHERIVRRIHDGPLQALSGITLHLRLIRMAADEKMREPLRGLEVELEQVIRQVREFIRTLRDPLPQASLEQRVRRALVRLEQSRGLQCSLWWREPAGALSPAAADELFHVINEALANVYRHSAARQVHVEGRARGPVFEVAVRDDGVGFDLSRALRQDLRSLSFGLFSMRERVNALGGLLTLRSQPGRGTRVLIQVPIGAVGAGGPPAAQNGGGRLRFSDDHAGGRARPGEPLVSPRSRHSRLRRTSGSSS
ncbi:MAG: histidine kinase [Armatimonadota bacterium]|nr:histidine kinase [Armatimonadota bacterium]MDR7458059.1 histidine kinase [Armatimonadota bacterium]MDR7497955.1 histidine kinase [Armatimonadota bacterium]MDR7510598.1 histidine kinase [Armatimonadota bacterium]